MSQLVDNFEVAVSQNCYKGGEKECCCSERYVIPSSHQVEVSADGAGLIKNRLLAPLSLAYFLIGNSFMNFLENMDMDMAMII
jgi:hypothetical protein